MKQFDIYTTAGGTYSSKPRPSVIIQSVGFDEFDSLTVIPMTTVSGVSNFRIKIEPSELNNLGSVGYVMIDKLTTIRKKDLGTYIGHVDNKYIDAIEKSLHVWLFGEVRGEDL
jgi:mRNA interferase MazF